MDTDAILRTAPTQYARYYAGSLRGAGYALVIDNGAYSSKFGYSDSPTPSRMIPNCISKSKKNKKKIVGEDIFECKDFSALNQSRPFDRGYLINWDMQREIWSLDAYHKQKLGRPFSPAETDLLLTEPIMNPKWLRRLCGEHMFEDVGFRSVLCCSASSLAVIHQQHANTQDLFAYSPCHLVVDVGYSFTHVVPFFDGNRLNHATMRVNVGGKLLTNYLKELVPINMADETFVMNIVKEKLCYVSSDFNADLAIAKARGRQNTIQRDYVLPDYSTSMEGYILTPELAAESRKNGQELQILTMNKERISVPEVLFHPSDIGMDQCGIAEAIVASIEKAPSEIRRVLYSNILIIGGSCLFSGFRERLESELRSLAPAEFDVRILYPTDPITAAWQGGQTFTQLPHFGRFAVTKQQYDEFGENLLHRKFSVL